MICGLNSLVITRAQAEQGEAAMKEASMKASTTSQHPQSALDNTTSATEIVEQAMNASKSVYEQGKTVLKDFHNKNLL